MKLKTCKDLASKLYSARPSSHEGDLALAAWQRCIHAIAETAVPTCYAEAFLEACERGGIWPS